MPPGYHATRIYVGVRSVSARVVGHPCGRVAGGAVRNCERRRHATQRRPRGGRGVRRQRDQPVHHPRARVRGRAGGRQHRHGPAPGPARPRSPGVHLAGDGGPGTGRRPGRVRCVRRLPDHPAREHDRRLHRQHRRRRRAPGPVPDPPARQLRRHRGRRRRPLDGRAVLTGGVPRAAEPGLAAENPDLHHDRHPLAGHLPVRLRQRPHPQVGLPRRPVLRNRDGRIEGRDATAWSPGRDARSTRPI